MTDPTPANEAWQPTFRFFSDKVAREITAEEGPGWHTEIDAARLTEPWSPCASIDPPDYWSVIAHGVGADGKPCVWPIALGLDHKTGRHICDLHNAAIADALATRSTT